MKEQLHEWVKQNHTRKKVVFLAIASTGVLAIVIGVVSIAILAVTGLFLLITGIGSFLLGRHLLVHAKAWQQRYLANAK